MSRTINLNIPRRRAKSENIYSSCNPVTYSKPESQNCFQEIANSFEKNNLSQNVNKKFEFDVSVNSEESGCNSISVSELFTKNTNRGVVVSWITKPFKISCDENEYSFNGMHLKSKCDLQLESGPFEYNREIGYIVTSNSYHRVCYGPQSFSKEYMSKLIYNQKEVLINEDGNGPFYSNQSSSVSGGSLPPHNIELEMDYSPTFRFEKTKNGNNLKEININENLFIYLTMRVFKNQYWKYFPAYVFQFHTSMSYKENLDGNLIESSHKCGIVSPDVQREFPLKVLSYPNRQNGEYIISKDSKSCQVCIESYPNSLMGLTKKEFRCKCQHLFKM